MKEDTQDVLHPFSPPPLGAGAVPRYGAVLRSDATIIRGNTESTPMDRSL